MNKTDILIRRFQAIGEIIEIFLHPKKIFLIENIVLNTDEVYILVRTSHGLAVEHKKFIYEKR